MPEPASRPGMLRSYSTQLVALALVAMMYFATRQPATSSTARHDLAARFRFSRQPLAVEHLARGELRQVRNVHPSLERISAWISATGAACTLGDLDRDGLANDLCLVDTRVDRVVVMPVPGTDDRFEAFALDETPLAFDAEKMSPTGTLIGDFNEDALPDILVHYWGRTPILFLRKSSDSAALGSTAPASLALGPGSFVARELVIPNRPAEPPARWYTHAATQADIDGDGHVDLVLGNFFQDGADILNAQGTGVATVMHAGKAKALNGGGGKLFLWTKASSGAEPEALFRDHTPVIENLCGKGWVLAAGAADLDRDGLPEIYFADDFGPDRLLHNRSSVGRPQFALAEGERTFTTPKSFVLGQDSFKGMGVAFADVNRDGFLDIYVSNIADEWALQESHMLWLSTARPEKFREGRAPYVQASEKLGVSRSGWGWDCKFGDFDNDGSPEALQATGFITGSVNRWPELQALGTSNDQIIHDPRFWPRFQPGADLSGRNSNPFYVMGPAGRFVDLAPELSLDEPMNTRGLSTADVDGDGRLDFVAANQWGQSYFFHNEAPHPGAFLGLHVLLDGETLDSDEIAVTPGHPGPEIRGRPAIGATATARLADGSSRIGMVDGGSGHSGRSSSDLHFGLGKLSDGEHVEVELVWRDARGKLRERKVSLPAGWQTVILGSPARENAP